MGESAEQQRVLAAQQPVRWGERGKPDETRQVLQERIKEIQEARDHKPHPAKTDDKEKLP